MGLALLTTRHVAGSSATPAPNVGSSAGTGAAGVVGVNQFLCNAGEAVGLGAAGTIGRRMSLSTNNIGTATSSGVVTGPVVDLGEVQVATLTSAGAGSTQGPVVDNGDLSVNAGSTPSSVGSSDGPTANVDDPRPNPTTSTGSGSTQGPVVNTGGLSVAVDTSTGTGASCPLVETFGGDKPAGQFYPFTQGPQTKSIIDFDPSVGEQPIALVPVAEPLTAGEPPIEPKLVPIMRTGLAKRHARSVSGHPSVFPAVTRTRPEFSVQWSSMTPAERELVRVFVRDLVGGRLNAITLRVDGTNTGTRSFRFLQDLTGRYIARGVHDTIEIQVEEVY